MGDSFTGKDPTNSIKENTEKANDTQNTAKQN